MTSRRFTIFSGFLATAGLALALAGCPDPEGAFEDFDERYNEIHQTTSTTTGSGGGAECVPATEGELDGRYMFTLSANLSPKKAFALDAQLTTTAAADGLTAELVLKPLSADDQITPTGTPDLTFTDLPVAADGSFTWNLGTVALPGAANPVTGADIEATLVLEGELCGADRVGFICGTASGALSKPFAADLAGSNWTMQAEVGGMLPSPVINCAKDPAVYN